MARWSAKGKDGSGRGSELPDGYFSTVFRRGPPGGKLVRKERSEHHRSALLHPSSGSRGSSVLGIENRLGHLPFARGKNERTGTCALPETFSGNRCHSPSARYAGRNRAARGTRLVEGGMRAHSRQNHAAPARGGTRLCESVPSLQLAGPGNQGRRD